jgi:hypothetical protein
MAKGIAFKRGEVQKKDRRGERKARLEGGVRFKLVCVRRRGRVKDLPSSVSRTCWIGQQDCIEQTRLQYGNVGRTYINELL